MKKIMAAAITTILVIIVIYLFQDTPHKQLDDNTRAQVMYTSLCVPPVKDIDWYSSDRKAPKFEGLEGIKLKVTTNNAEAQQYFNQGLMLAYGFNHAEAARSFYQGIREDSSCAMCYWGYAYVLGPNYNAGMEADNYERAYDAVQKAVRFSVSCSDVEKALILALSTRYVENPPVDRTHLDLAYAEAMKKAFRQFPENSDIATLYAESLMDLHPWDLYDKKGVPRPWTPEIVNILADVISSDPRHAGAHHFYIHAVEASSSPEDGLKSAAILKDLVKGSSHLLHMPSHIYINTGHYHEGTLANIRAVAVDSGYVTACHAQGVYPLAYYPHNYHFMAATATLGGESKHAMMAAKKTSDLVSIELMKDPAWATLQHYYIIPYHVAVKFARWDEIMEMENYGARLAYPESVRHYARGMAFLSKNDIVSARKELSALEEYLKDPALEELTIWEINPISTLVEISREVLLGEILAKEGDYEKSILSLQQALEMEDGLNYNEPPDWFFSIRHHLGAVLVEAGRFQEAIQVYQEDLDLFPDNGWAYAGLYRAYLGANNLEAAEKTRSLFDEVWQWSDTSLSGSRIWESQEMLSMK